MASTAIVPNEDYSVDHDPSAKGFLLKGDEINPGANMVYGTDGSGTKGWQSASAADGSETKINAGARVTVSGTGTTADPYVIASDAPDGSETEVTAGSNVTVTGSGTTADPYVVAASAGGGSAAMDQDNLSNGGLTADVDRLGGSATVLSNPSAGEYELEVQSGAYMDGATIFGNNSNLNASQELVLKIDNSANSRNRRFIVQLYDANNDGLVDQQITSTNHTQEVAGNITTITIPGLNGFGGTGFRVELR